MCDREHFDTLRDRVVTNTLDGAEVEVENGFFKKVNKSRDEQ